MPILDQFKSSLQSRLEAVTLGPLEYVTPYRNGSTDRREQYALFKDGAKVGIISLIFDELYQTIHVALIRLDKDVNPDGSLKFRMSGPDNPENLIPVFREIKRRWPWAKTITGERETGRHQGSVKYPIR